MARIIPDTYDKLFCRCDGTGTSFVDSSTANPKTITANGNATQLPIKFNRTAGFFNGTTNYVVAPHSADWTPGTDFTVEAFVMFNTVGNVYFISQNASAPNEGWYLSYFTGVFYFGVSYDGTNFVYGTKTQTPVVNQWYHIAGVKNGNSLDVYVDGVKGSVTGDFSGKTANDSTAVLNIGNVSTAYFNGWMKELRISNVARTISVPTAQYSSDSNTKLLLHFDNPATSPIGPAIAFDGTDDFLTVPDSSDFNIGSGDFTIDFWVSFSALQNGSLVTQGFTGTNNLAFDLFWLDAATTGTTNQLRFMWSTDGTAGTRTILNNVWLPIVNVWYNVSVVRNGSNLLMFVNGQQIGTTQTMNQTVYNSNSSLYVGGYTTFSINGLMREVRLSNTARYTSAFTPSQTGFTVDANTKLYIKGNENNGVTTFIDQTGKTVTTSGDTKIKYGSDYRETIFKDDGNTGHKPYPQGSAKVDFFAAFGSGVGAFDGNGDYISIPDDNDWDVDTDISYEFFARYDTLPTNSIQWIIHTPDGTNNYVNFYDTYIGGVRKLGLYAYVGGVVKASYDMTNAWNPIAGVWYHIAYVKSGSTQYIFINGIAQALTTSTAWQTVGAMSGSLYVGGNPYFNSFPGRLDNVRISKGIARYTTTFNPPEDVLSGGNKIIWIM